MDRSEQFGVWKTRPGKRLQKTVENHILLWLNQLFWLGHGFNSYVKLPEGKCSGARRTSSLSTTLATCPMSNMPWGKICTQKLPKPGGLVKFRQLKKMQRPLGMSSTTPALFQLAVSSSESPGSTLVQFKKPATTQGDHRHIIFQWGYWSYLVGGIPTPLKNDGVRQLGWWNSQYTDK